MAETVAPAGSVQSPPRHAGALLAVACAAQFVCVLDTSIVNVALPPMQDTPRALADRPAVGGEQLHAHLRRLPAARRPGR